MIISNVFTIAKPERNCTCNEIRREMVVCHPGITEVAKSIDTSMYRKYKWS
jgi:hypothetical protein